MRNDARRGEAGKGVLRARDSAGLSVAFGWGDEETSWSGPLADPPDQREVKLNSMVGLLARGSNRAPAFPTHRASVDNGHPSPPTVAGAAPDLDPERPAPDSLLSPRGGVLYFAYPI